MPRGPRSGGKQLTELVAVFSHLKGPFGTQQPPFVILHLDDDKRAVGNADPSTFEYGLTYRFTGYWEQDQRWGPQFRFVQQPCPSAPQTEDSVVMYLQKAGGIGPVLAHRIYERFGSQTMDVVRDEPDRIVREVKGVAAEVAERASLHFQKIVMFEATTIELNKLLGGRGFPKTLIDKLILKWRSNAVKTIRENPYVLMTFSGVGFLRADKLYIDLGLPPDAIVRQAYCAWHEVNRDNQGHTWLPVAKAVAGVEDNIAGATAKPEEAIALATVMRLTDTCTVKGADGTGERWIAEVGKSTAEATVAIRVREAIQEDDEERHPVYWPDASELEEVTDHQREAAAKAMQGRIGLLAGSPGTGKSFTLAAIVKAILRQGGHPKIAVVAPTGLAAKRVAKFLYERGVQMPATTIHRALGVQKSDGGEWMFVHGKENPLPHRFIFVDESSMLDCYVASCLLNARAAGSHIMFVGDTNQLSPVGHGKPLLDLIDAGLPLGRLTEIHRNSGAIVRVCKEIRETGTFTCPHTFDLPTGNLACAGNRNPDSQIQILLNALSRVKDMGHDPIWDAQVITPVNQGTPVSRKALNTLLQEYFNADADKVQGSPFRVNDKVICTKNGWAPAVEVKDLDKYGLRAKVNQDEYDEFMAAGEVNEDGEVSVANGEIGRVLQAEQRLTFVRLQDPVRFVKIPRGSSGKAEGEKAGSGEKDAGDDDTVETGCQWTHAYALTFHKCVHPDTLVETKEGLLPISKISQAGTIVTHDGTAGYVNCRDTGKMQVRRVLTRDGYEITVSRDHFCEVWGEGGYQKVTGSDLKVGDIVRLKLGVGIEPLGQVQLPPRPSADVRCIPYQVPTEMSAEFAEFLGLMVADGTVFRSGFRLVKRHTDVVERFSNLCEHLFDAPAYPISVNCKYPSAEIRSRLLSDWLLSIGGLGPNAKAIPECILRSSSDIHTYFLRGLFEDGTVNLKGDRLDHVEWSSCYPEMVKTVRVMLLRLGIISGMTIADPEKLYIYGVNAKRFAEKVGFISEFKSSRLRKETGSEVRYWVPVLKRDVPWWRDTPGFSEYDYQGARDIGRVSRATAGRLALAGVEWAIEGLKWHHTRIRSIEESESNTMCLTVPGIGRFVQNGFPWWNSQGSAWPWVFGILDASPKAKMVSSRELLYTGISRAEIATLLIGDMRDALAMCKRSSLNLRKTMLTRLIVDPESVVYGDVVGKAEEVRGGAGDDKQSDEQDEWGWLDEMAEPEAGAGAAAESESDEIEWPDGM